MLAVELKDVSGFWFQSVAASRSTTVRMMPRDDRPWLREVSGGFWPDSTKGAPIGGTWWVTNRPEREDQGQPADRRAQR